MLKRKLLLLSPGYYEFGDYGYSDMPPMGLLKIARHFKNKGVDFEYYDLSLTPNIISSNKNLKTIHPEAPFNRYLPCGNFNNEKICKPQKYYGAPISVIKEIITNAKPTEIWITSGLTYYWESLRELVILCKEIYPSVPVLVGGIYASLCPQHCLDNMPVDYLHQGPIDDIDDLFPDYSVDSHRSNSTIRTIQLGKGCNVDPACSFCSVIALDNKFKYINDKDLFEYISNEYNNGVRFFKFWASQLLVPKSRLKNLMNRILSSGMQIQMVASEGVQPSLFDQEISDLMYKAGFVSVSIPMESIEEKSIEDFRKPSTFTDYENAVRCAQKSGFKKIKSFVMIGVPGQTYDEVIHAIVDCWARDVSPALHQYTPIPGSYDWERFTQFHNVSPELLHPSLWPGASNDLKVEYLEEIKRLAKLGPIGLCNPKYIKINEIWNIFHKWCKHYELITNNNFNGSKLSVNDYTSEWTDKVLLMSKK